jgi:hypothetical protein
VSDTAPDTTHAALVKDHPYFENSDPNRFLCEICNLSVASHEKVANSQDEIKDYIHLKKEPYVHEDADAGRVEQLGKVDLSKVAPPLTGHPPPRRAREEIMAKEGHKDDAGKTPWHLLPWDGLEEVAYVMEYGAKKYSMGNYRKGMDLFRLMRAGIGHWIDWWRGEDNDPETGRSHLAHSACCVLMAIESIKIGTATDNRYAKTRQRSYGESVQEAMDQDTDGRMK